MAGERRRKRRGMTAQDWRAWRRGEEAALGMPAAEAKAEAARREERVRLRIAWGLERLDAFFEMQERAGEAYERQIEAHPGVDWDSPDAPELPEPPEEAIAQAIYAEVMAAINEDRWPRHLHFPEV